MIARMQPWLWSTMVVLVGLSLMALKMTPWESLGGRGLLEHTFRPYHDEMFQALLVERLEDGEFLAHDDLVDSIVAYWPKAYFHVWKWVKGLLGSLSLALLVLTLLFGAIFIWGCQRLGTIVTGSQWAGALVAWISAGIPREALIAEWGMEILLPRCATMAFAPALMVFYLRAGPRGRTWPLFFVLGLLANLHPLSALHLVGLLAVAMLLENAKASLRPLAIGAVACLVGAAPVIGHFGGLPTTSPPDLEIVAQSSFAYFVDPYFYKAMLLLCGFVFLAVPAVAGAVTLDKGGSEERRFRYIATAVVLLSSTHVLTYLSPSLIQYSPLRVTKFLYPVVYVYGAALIVRLFDGRRPVRMAVGLGVLAMMVLPLGPRVYGALCARVESFDVRVKESLATLPRAYSLDVDVTAHWEPFHEMASWCEKNTGKESLFLVPPRGFSPFRLYARRSVVVLGEDSVVGLYEPEVMRLWLKRLDAVVTARIEGGSVLTEAARRFGASHVVQLAEEPPIGAGRVLFENERYRVVGLD